MQAIPEPAVLNLELMSAPESVALVRAGLKGLGAELDLEPELLEDLQMAASEACNNVVLHAYRTVPGPLAVWVTATRSGVDLRVIDHGVGVGDLAPADERSGLGLSVIEALADRIELVPVAGGGTEVRIGFARPISALIEADHLDLDALEPTWVELAGDVKASVFPIVLLPGVLGRLARALAAQARFSVERFAEIHLIVESLVAHAQRFARGGRISFAFDADTRRLRLKMGPLLRRREDAEQIRARESAEAPLLHKLVDDLHVEAQADAEVLCVTLSDEGLAHALGA